MNLTGNTKKGKNLRILSELQFQEAHVGYVIVLVAKLVKKYGCFVSNSRRRKRQIEIASCWDMLFAHGFFHLVDDIEIQLSQKKFSS